MWVPTEGFADTVPVQQATEFFGVPCVPGLAHETVQTQPSDKQEVHLLVSGEQLGAHVKIWVCDTRGVQYPNSDVEWSTVAIVNAEALEGACECGSIFDHVVPEPRVVFRARSVPEFDAITPNDDLPAKIGLGRWHGKVLEGIGIPDPSVVG